MGNLLKILLTLLYFWQICQSDSLQEGLRVKRQVYPKPDLGLPPLYEGNIKWDDRTDKFQFSETAVKKHFAPDDVVTAIMNSMKSKDSEERNAAKILAALQRPSDLSWKEKITDAPVVYTDWRFKKRVKFQTTKLFGFGEKKYPKLDGVEMTLRKISPMPSTFFKNSDFPREIKYNHLHPKGQWESPSKKSTQVVFSDGKRIGLKLKVNKTGGKADLKLIEAAEATNILKLEENNLDFKFSGGIANPMVFEHYLANFEVNTPAFANAEAYDKCLACVKDYTNQAERDQCASDAQCHYN